MAITAGEQASGGEVRDNDGRLIVVGPGGVAIGGGGGGSDPLSDGTPGGALPSKTLWIAGANGAVLQGIAVNGSGHVLTAVQNFPATQAVSDGGGSLTVDGTVTANAGTGPWPVTDNGGTLSVDDGAGSLTVDGSVSVSNFPATQPVSGTFFQATQPVSGTVNIGSAPQVAVNNVETLVDNAGFTDGTSRVFPQGYIFDESAGTALTENDIAAARIDSKRASVQVLEDGTTRGVRATIKAASTAPVATDTAQVVAVSPNSPQFTQAAAPFARPRKLVTYRATFRAAATPWILTQTTVANTKHQQLTIHHAAAATKTVRLRHLWYSIFGNTVAGVLHVTLYRLTSGTTPATGNPAVTPSLMSTADGAAEATCLVKPTTAGTEGALISHQGGNLGVAAPSTVPSAFISPMIDLLEMAPNFDDEAKVPDIRAGILEGYGVSIEMSSVTNISLIFIAEFTEE